MHVAFINENILGHASYLLPLVTALQNRPELGIEPHLINASPLPSRLEDWIAYYRVPWLRKRGLDFSQARYRLIASRYVRQQLDQLQHRQTIDALVVNTQSVGLGLIRIARELPVFVCLDATFAQMIRMGWFTSATGSRRFLPVTLAPIRQRESTLLHRAHGLLAWSEGVRQSLVCDYQIPSKKIFVLPPSISVPSPEVNKHPKDRPQILFVGGEFDRKGGPLLLDCYRQYLADCYDLHLVTQTDVKPEPGVFVHRGLVPHSRAWRERWEQADVFVFPSLRETFGIVLVEALAFQVPVVSAEVGAAREILADGQAGLLLPRLNKEALAAAIKDVLNRPAASQARIEKGYRHVEAHFNLETNVERLAAILKG